MVNLMLSDIESFVRAKLDELSNNNDAGFVSSDNLDIMSIIQKSVVPVIRNIHLTAPNVLLDGTIADVKVYYNNTGYIYVPATFMRLVSLIVDGWERPVQTLIAEDSVEYRKQKNKFLCGTMRNPVAAITHISKDERIIIELYPATGAMAHLKYVPEITLGNNAVSICPKLRQACLYAMAAEVMRCVDEMQKAQVLEALAQRFLNPLSDNERLYPTAGEKTI